jgi:nitroreductase
MSMEFYEAVNTRRTVRRFQSKPVEEKKIRRVLEAGYKAPSNAHLKYWEFILMKDPENRRKALADAMGARNLDDPDEIEKLVESFEEKELKKVYRKSLTVQLTMMLEAPEVLLVCYKMPKKLEEVERMFDLNNLASVWMCIENIVLAMATEGLFGCTYTPYKTENLKRFLGIPSDYEVAVVLPFGYPLSQPQKQPDVLMDSKIHIDRW